MNKRIWIAALVLALLSALLLIPLAASARLIGGEMPLVHLNFHEAHIGGTSHDWGSSSFAIGWLDKSNFNSYYEPYVGWLDDGTSTMTRIAIGPGFNDGSAPDVNSR